MSGMDSIRPDPNNMVLCEREFLCFCNLAVRLAESMHSISNPAAIYYRLVSSVLTDWESFYFAFTREFALVRCVRTYVAASSM